jgi:PAS domain S-box-containing protein
VGAISGYSAEEIFELGCWLPIVHADDRQEVAAYLFGLSPGDVKQQEFRITTKDGQIRWISETASCKAGGDEGELILFGAAKDITERKLAEDERDNLSKQLLHAQKLESLGVLAGGIAHDFNNILTSIVGNADLALMRVSKESPAIDNLHKIEQAASRAADLAKQMLAYSGKGKFVVENLDLNRLLKEMLHLLEVSISKRVELILNISPDLPAVEADATQIQQVIMNLVINASEAIGDMNGTITINTGYMDCNKKYLHNFWPDNSVREGQFVYLEITDSGCGMDKDTLDKIFDPFFTTKFTGRGLGMSAVHGIIRGHKGAINVYSEPNKGTSFKVLLPASGKLLEVKDNNVHQDNWHGEGLVLLVDDEETVRDIGKEMLQELGFSVITANDGKEALEVFKDTADITFVILDLTMPKIDGEQCFRELKQIKPVVKVVISSGFSEYEVIQKFAGEGLAGFIQKPYKMSALKEVIRGIT